MKLWLLRALEPDKGPWGVHDVAVGFVIRAELENEARYLASQNHGDEGIIVWFDPKLVSCKELIMAGERGAILRDFQAA